MPYLNWATEGERQKLNAITGQAKAKQSSNSPLDEEAIVGKTDRYEKLLWTYLLDDHPLHIRRTLDQSYYGSLPSTEDRDKDQIPFKFFKEHYPGLVEMGQYPVLMVDQLWMWILDSTVPIPRRWPDTNSIECKTDRYGPRYCDHKLPTALDGKEKGCPGF